jgi:hypothetical protein
MSEGEAKEERKKKKSPIIGLFALAKKVSTTLITRPAKAVLSSANKGYRVITGQGKKEMTQQKEFLAYFKSLKGKQAPEEYACLAEPFRKARKIQALWSSINVKNLKYKLGLTVERDAADRSPSSSRRSSLAEGQNAALAQWARNYAAVQEFQRSRWLESATQSGGNISFYVLKHLCRKGVPSEVRHVVWQWCLAGGHLNYLSVFNKHYFKYLLTLMNPATLGSIGDSYTAAARENQTMIDKDVDRTFVNRAEFKRASTRTQLTNVLTCFALANPDVGYVQGLNYIAGVCLSVSRAGAAAGVDDKKEEHPSTHSEADSDEKASAFTNASMEVQENAFYLMMLLVRHAVPREFYSAQDNLLACHVYAHVFVFLLKRKCRLLHDHIIFDTGVDLASTVVMPMFLSVFAQTLPFESVLRVWDSLCAEGIKVLFRVAMALFRLRSKEIFAIGDTGVLYNYLTGEMGHEMLDCDLLMTVACSKECKVTRHEIEELRQKVCVGVCMYIYMSIFVLSCDLTLPLTHMYQVSPVVKRIFDSEREDIDEDTSADDAIEEGQEEEEGEEGEEGDRKTTSVE